ncbi:ferredoxin reductase family protein [Thauera linaloolentis]|uniref:Ferric reductase n=1 Tax=Thauera linaloolentis (strain DSM 12138 / JCM 21573 / CCUG 41526 / CIP 105981 / IAM 15112 / NBRC 102519 / 47Lol) TaxID=1123367 RepID=N6ZCU4_THAL4|nr:ferric reductase-like transmembrane domain-containing protein [Thauera linaloolentis]ENO90004.1 ferric reductase [Thauera linaloolentis 47Lol = DSM 12138]MCM8566568.1 ferric reductase-like transmembrane domain-containing protein [Thauera linaloolentis]
MKPIKAGLLALLGGLTMLWLLADTFLPQPFGYFPLRKVMVQYSGVIAMGAMSAAMVLALRPLRLEPLFGGLDKMYRLHKWLGVAALVSGTIHWVFAKGTKWAVGWGWLVKPGKGGGAQAYDGVEALLRTQRGLAESVGEWTFYAVVILIVLALVKRFPYRLFARTHTLLAAGYLLLVFHSVILIEHDYWTQPIGIAMALLMAAGSLAACIGLAGRIGHGRRTGGRIAALTHYPEMHTLVTRIQLDEGWKGHEAGQFAFVTSDRREGAHPYTIASAWDPDTRQITFVTKGLGDHTRRLPERLKAGDPVTVEGPYGRFTFSDRRPQIWIGAGIGITPFLARLQYLAGHRGENRDVDLFHPTAALAPQARDILTESARAAGARLHLLVGDGDGRLDGERLRRTVPGWKDASIWFCGPSAFGRALRADLIAHGLAPEAFHQELFEMR